MTMEIAWKKIESAPKAKLELSKFEVLGMKKWFQDKQLKAIKNPDFVWHFDKNEVCTFSNGVQEYPAINGGEGADYYELYRSDSCIYLDHFYLSENGKLIFVIHNYSEATEEDNKFFVEYYMIEDEDEV